MTASWEPGTQYGYGDIVEFEGARYKIIQPHRSQSDWAPSVTPALWGKIPDDKWKDHEPYNPPHDKGDYHGQDVQQPSDYNNHPDQTVEVPHEEQKQNWWDLDDDRKKKLKIGGGIAAGLGIIGAGYYAYHKHEEHKKSEEDKDALAWGVQGWAKESQVKTEEFRNHGPRAPATWVLVEGRDNIPPSAFMAIKYTVARAYFEHGLQIGKASANFRQGSAIGYAGKVIELPTFEVLVADPKGVRWVEGGKEANGTLLYVARVRYNEGLHPAKIGEHLPAAHLAFNGTEVLVEDYEVLCYN
ncbi:hypothetical protein EDB92DRAFT_1852498 [Lactarius akahatsu]|uniref:Chitin-binding type-3 domain-containing protein n=1 Tax=Lactarius akahatsu TaxID=416441 RepID=A0AAD4LM55_9AGAM|nr:hypothetical protein EDB92DRAFT_1852498 [Lactarius akahatsu]